MKIQFLNGGLANQAFQYIFARYYELSHPGEIMFMDDSYFALNTVHNGYELEKVFGIKAHMLSECFDEEVWNYILEEKGKGKSIPQIFSENEIDIYMLSEVGKDHAIFNPFYGHVMITPCNEYTPNLLDLPGNVYYHGYWLNKNWFNKYKDIFLQESHFPDITDEKNLGYKTEIESSDSVAIHIRRGDYVTLGWDVKPDLYHSAIKKFVNDAPGNWHGFIFSDDIQWCSEHIQELGLEQLDDLTFVEGNMSGQNFRDLQLMSMCKGMIISTSAFCFLAALLNTQKYYYINLSQRDL